MPALAELAAPNPVLESLTNVVVTPPRPITEDDDRNLFDCGRESLNSWFRRHAWANQASDLRG